MRRASGIVAVALIGLLFTGGTAQALASQTRTTFHMVDHGTHVTYKGEVSADPDRTACIRGREVKIFHNRVLIAQTRTDADGKWKVDGPRPPRGDNVTVKITKKRRRGRLLCRAFEFTKMFR